MYNGVIAITYPATERRFVVEVTVMFAISVAASIVAYYICKWLDRDDDDN